MTDLTESRLAEAEGSAGMVATAHYLASQAGIWMLQRGGNAVDAAVCSAATIAVVCPNLNGVGSDLFAQVWLPDEDRPLGLNASGRSGSLATIDYIHSHGHEEMPDRGPLSINVPGAVSGWMELLARFGTRRLYDVLEPAISYAEHGSPVTAGIARAIQASADFLLADPQCALIFGRAGRRLQEGQAFINRELGASLRELGRTDGEAMYRGHIADRLAFGLEKAGSHITLHDLHDHRADWVDPVVCSFSDFDVYELPPNSQGISALEMLNLCEAGGVPMAHNSAEYVARLCMYVQLAIEDRDRYITDPTFVEPPTERLVSKEYAENRLRGLTSAPKDANEADTIYLCAVDRSGMAVSLIQSQYKGFGSGFMAPGTGIHLNNRGSYFSLDPAHVNRIEPRKRTMHTLMPGMAGNHAKRIVFGTMGGDAQPQIHLQVLLNHLVFGMPLQRSIEAPRFVWAPLGGNVKRVQLEGRFPPKTVSDLREMAWDVVVLEEWSSQMGHAQAIVIDRASGALTGAADPRGDGLAIGI